MGRLRRTLVLATLITLAQTTCAAATVLRADGSRIDYYLMQREASKPSDQLLVVIQGSDCNSVTRVEAISRFVVNVMPNADVLTVEKYGIEANLPYDDDTERADCPVAYLRHDSPAQRAHDLDSVIAALVQQNGYREVVAIGGSEGALVANLLAVRSKSITATVAFNGGGRWFLDDVIHSITRESVSEDEKSTSIEGMRGFAEHIRSASPAAQKDLKASGHGYRWWRESLDIDQLSLLRQSVVPTLIIQSGRDEWVSPDSALAMVAILRQEGKRNIVYKAFPALDHRLNDADGQSRMPEVMAYVAIWLRNVSASRSQDLKH